MGLDMNPFCDPAPQKKLEPVRERLRVLEEEEKLDVISYANQSLVGDKGCNFSGYYQLIGVLTHTGRTADSGHYIGWVRKDDTDDWYKFDDDYVLMMKTTNEEEVQEFRLLHRLMMRSHGFNDSNKKTNTQQQMMEFISLVSLNGNMTYPQIKKAKEVGLNVSCTGYRNDMDMVLSRVAEAVRIGMPITSCYAMMKIHSANICSAYSLLPNQTNNMFSLREALDNPVELFGIPDVHSLLLFLCKGSPNNYRLMFYGNPSVRQLIRYLFESKKIVKNSKMLTFDIDTEEQLGLYHPTYTFDKENKTIKQIRYQVGVEYSEVNKFWDEHKTLNFIKPRCKELFHEWLSSMYFKENFALAYSRQSRANITLRLSTFVKSSCLMHTLRYKKQLNDTKYNISPDDIPKFTIKEYLNEMIQNTKQSDISDKPIDPKSEKELLRCLMKCDSTISSLYSIFESARPVEKKTYKLRKQFQHCHLRNLVG